MAPYTPRSPNAGGANRVSRRRLPAVLGALAMPGARSRRHDPSGRASASEVGAAATETIAAIGQVALPATPLEVHVARVVLPPGVSLASATPGGVRLLAVTAGALTVELAATAPSDLLAEETPPGQRLVVPAGRAIALAARAVVGVGNAGARPAVALDAAVFGEGAHPPARAFTTEAGVGFQVLAGGLAGLPPPGRCAVALAHCEIPPGADVALAGMALVYAESGTGQALATAGDVRYARAAGQAPGSAAGPWRAVGANREAPLTAGSALLLDRAAAALVGNPGQRAVRLLLVTVRPEGGEPGGNAGFAPAGTDGEATPIGG